MRTAAWVVGLLFGLFLVVRAIVELFVIDWSNPASYRDDWGGPGLFGVLLVHVGPGIIAAVLIIATLLRWRSQEQHRAGPS